MSIFFAYQYPEEEKYRLSEKFVDNIYGTVILFGRDR